MIRRIVGSLCLCCLVLGGVGCLSSDVAHNIYPHADSDTMTLAGKDHHERILQAMRQDERSLIEDLDVFYMTERPSRLNRWHSK